MKTGRMKILIVDDEAEAIDNLRNMLAQVVDDSVTICGEASDSLEAEMKIIELKPDVVFLDIEMPGENAFQFLERIDPYEFEVVFITAFDQFAVKAFKLSAIDYILKPLCLDELQQALEKVKFKLQFKAFSNINAAQLETLHLIANQEKPAKITLKGLNHIEVVDFKDIYYVEGQGSYCKFVYNKKGAVSDIVVSNALSEYEELLPMDVYYRIHKSYIVNCKQIKNINNGENLGVVTSNDDLLPVSRRRYISFINFLKDNYFYIG